MTKSRETQRVLAFSKNQSRRNDLNLQIDSLSSSEPAQLSDFCRDVNLISILISADSLARTDGRESQGQDISCVRALGLHFKIYWDFSLQVPWHYSVL